MMRITGSINAQLGWTNDPVTLSDVKEWVKRLEDLNIPIDTELSVCNLEVEVEYPEVYTIECGDCIPQKEHFGFCIWTECCGDERK